MTDEAKRLEKELKADDTRLRRMGARMGIGNLIETMIASPGNRSAKPLTKPEDFEGCPEPEYKCKACKDSGWIEEEIKDCELVPPGGRPYTQARQCQCVPIRHYKQSMEILDQENERFRGLTLSTYETENEVQEIALAACAKWVEAWPDVDRGILLMGTVGSGKTGLLLATAKAAGFKTHEIPRILRALDLAEAPVFTTRDDPDTLTRNDIIMRSVRRRLLIFDDLGVGKRTESSDGAYFRLLDKRHLACMPTLVTTNYIEEVVQTSEGGYIEKFETRVGGRLYSRLRQSCDFYDISGTDRRRTNERKK